MNKANLLTLIVVISICNVLLAQVELINVTPLSPNAASIARYGETSIGHFTGVPNIAIPIHTIQSGDLKLPLTLSYHAGGVRVEDIASWVGLGWSLSGIPVISRSVRNSPDEGTASTIGYFQNFSGKTIVENQTEIHPDNFRYYLYDGVIDGAPDIFSLSLNGKSLKFFYNQQEEKFYTLPLSNVKIEYFISYGFIVTDDNGDIYFFNEKETSSTTANLSTDPFASSWYVSKIVNLNRTDSISFTYQIEAQNIVQIAPRIQYINGPCGANVPEGSLTSITATTSKRISSINYRGGSVTFVADTNPRLDLNGGYALSKIQIHNGAGLLKSFGFNFIYSTSQSGGYCDGWSLKRLILDSVTESDADNIAQNPYRFEYMSPNNLPCRLSFAQDYWGFYNGMNANTSLVPTSVLQILAEPVEIQGANRNVNPNLTHYGTLSKIHYPTGGYTEFVFENNEVLKGATIPTNYTFTSASLEGEETITTNYYYTEFEIDNSPDPILNGFAPNGGAFVNIYFGDVGCDLSQGQNSCATIGITRMNPASPAIYVPISGYSTGTSIYLPNGSYKLEALFDQNPPQYQSFYVVVNWKIDANPSDNAFVGGLRIKEIITHDGMSTANDIRRKFYYNDLVDSTRSSGDIFGVPYFNHVEYDISWDYFQCIRLVSNPTAQRVTHSGSYTGYKSVTEEYFGPSQHGKTEYTFTHVKDESGDAFPYPPADSFEYLRGQPVTITYYSRTGANFIPVKKLAYEYTNLMVAAAPISSVAFGIYDLAPLGSPRKPAPVTVAQYEMKTGWSAPSLITETSYDQQNGSLTLESTQALEYTSYMQTKAQTYASSGELKETRNYYPFNISLGASSELLQKNNLVAILRKENYSDSILTETINVEYTNGLFYGKELTVPSIVTQKIGNGETESRIEYQNYNGIGRIVDQKKSNDVPLSYLWDEVNGLLLAEVQNATSDNIYHTSFEGTGTVETVSNPARTGRRYLNSGTYNFSGNGFVPASTTNLKMSYWYWSSNKWNFSGVVNWSNTISAGARLDEIRVFPGDSQMTTYTYVTGIGITSMTDANNVTTYYEYDSFGRLNVVKDDKGNIVQNILYHLKAGGQ
ncbi:MAG: RHS repeat protein [Cyclobacteriaceae bacterium]|nr:RHS repeat protein [Cyclobacteriaceae bacterium]